MWFVTYKFLIEINVKDHMKAKNNFLWHLKKLLICRVSLHEAKTKLSHNLRRLENQGLANKADNYQSLLTAIARDIKSQRDHKIARINVSLSWYIYYMETSEPKCVNPNAI